MMLHDGHNIITFLLPENYVKGNHRHWLFYKYDRLEVNINGHISSETGKL
jgi:hypothetical protein